MMEEPGMTQQTFFFSGCRADLIQVMIVQGFCNVMITTKQESNKKKLVRCLYMRQKQYSMHLSPFIL
jgi:hypothetical protein